MDWLKIYGYLIAAISSVLWLVKRALSQRDSRHQQALAHNKILDKVHKIVKDTASMIGPEVGEQRWELIRDGQRLCDKLKKVASAKPFSSDSEKLTKDYVRMANTALMLSNRQTDQHSNPEDRKVEENLVKDSGSEELKAYAALKDEIREHLNH